MVNRRIRNATKTEDGILETSFVGYFSGSTFTKLKGNDIKGVSKEGSLYALTSSAVCSEPYLRNFVPVIQNKTGSMFELDLCPTQLTGSATQMIIGFRITSGTSGVTSVISTPPTAFTASIKLEFKNG